MLIFLHPFTFICHHRANDVWNHLKHQFFLSLDSLWTSVFSLQSYNIVLFVFSIINSNQPRHRFNIYLFIEFISLSFSFYYFTIYLILKYVNFSCVLFEQKKNLCVFERVSEWEKKLISSGIKCLHYSLAYSRLDFIYILFRVRANIEILLSFFCFLTRSSYKCFDFIFQYHVSRVRCVIFLLNFWCVFFHDDDDDEFWWSHNNY